MKFIIFGLVFAVASAQYAPSSEYLPPHQENGVEIGVPSNQYIAPAAEEQTVLANDGYRYKTVRRFRSRVRRDVSELPSAEYLPPSQEVHIEAPSNQYIAPAAEEQTVLANDGYRYKTVRRFRSRVRRDVSELPSAEYLPPSQEVHIEVPSNQYIALAAEEQTIQADDGYRYRTVKKYKTRRH